MLLRSGLLIVCLVAPLQGRGEISATNQPFPGIAIHSETRQSPPQRLFVAIVDLTRPTLKLHVAAGGPDPDGDGPWQTSLMQPTKIAAREHFDLVVNGDFFRARGVKDAEGASATFHSATWSSVTGPAATAGRAWSVCAQPRPCLVVTKSGKVEIRPIAQPATNDWEVISGNAMLVHDGKALKQKNKVRHPRTVVGLNRAATTLVLLVVDGRKAGIAQGMNYDELATEMLRLGCTEALNLDGGGSSVIAVRDAKQNNYQILNSPTDGRERAVANALGITASESETH